MNDSENAIKIDDFVQESVFVDFKHASILKKAEEITRRKKNEKEKLIAIFEYVRDSIPYKFGTWQKKASEVLDQGYGMCTNKSVLLVALFRAIGVPAGFGMLRVKGQEYFGSIAPLMLARRAAESSVHFYTVIYLRGKWQKIDPATDLKLSMHSSYFNVTTKLIVWDGEKNAMDKIAKSHIMSDIFPIAGIDDRLRKKPKNAKGMLIFVANIYLDFLRNNRKKIVDPRKELEPLFKNWLKANHFYIYYLYFFSYYFRELKKKIYSNF